MPSAQDRGWGRPGCRADQLAVVAVPGIRLNVRSEVAPLFVELVDWLTRERAADRVPALSSSGGYVKRFIDGTTTWSNHSWGLAADFNAGTNEYGWNATTDMPDGTSATAKRLGMRWGGDYTGKKDGMHFEFMGTPADASRIAAGLRPKPVGWSAVSERTQRAVSAPVDGLWGLLTDASVNVVRNAINGGFPLGVREAQRVVRAEMDGWWGAGSRSALTSTIARLQRAWGTGVDGAWGEDTQLAWKKARDECFVDS
jgi:hypothetical protein